MFGHNRLAGQLRGGSGWWLEGWTPPPSGGRAGEVEWKAGLILGPTTLEASEKGTVPLRNRQGLCCLEEHGSEYTSGRWGWGPERLEV